VAGVVWTVGPLLAFKAGGKGSGLKIRRSGATFVQIVMETFGPSSLNGTVCGRSSSRRSCGMTTDLYSASSVQSIPIFVFPFYGH